MDVSDDVDEDPTGNRALWDRGVLSGASQKVSHNFCNDMILISLR